MNFVFFLKESNLFIDIFYRFCMFANKILLLENAQISKIKNCSNVKPSVYFLCEGNYLDRFRNLH